jgi:hypothetical protein
VTIKSYSQIDALAQKIPKRDTVTTHSLIMDLDFLLLINQKQSYDFADISVVNTGRLNYIMNRTNIELDYRQIVDRMDDGSTYSSHYLLFSSGINKYKPITNEKSVLRTLYPEPVIIFQNNDWRGLQWRFQTGILLNPATFSRPKFKSNLGLGLIYDWSSWEVNNQKKIDKATPELREMILFVNSHSKLVKNMYMHHNEFRPMFLLNLYYQINDFLNFSLTSSYQQSLASPFSEEIKSAYPQLAKVYPYSFSRLTSSVKIFKGFSLKTTFTVDYENNNLSIYDSSWEYSILFGISWNFIKRKKM